VSTYRTVATLERYASRLNAQCASMCGPQAGVVRRHAMRVQLVAALLLNITSSRPTPVSERSETRV
jgi:hypothetical protein